MNPEFVLGPVMAHIPARSGGRYQLPDFSGFVISASSNPKTANRRSPAIPRDEASFIPREDLARTLTIGVDLTAFMESPT